MLDGWLQIIDPQIAQKYFNHRTGQFDFLFSLYIAMEFVFKAFRTFQTQIGAGDWDLTTGARVLTPNKDERLIYAVIGFSGYAFIVAVYLMARFKYAYLYKTLCTLLVCNMVLYQYLYMPYSPAAPREFMMWSILLLFRCTIVVGTFQLNGLIDLII